MLVAPSNSGIADASRIGRPLIFSPELFDIENLATAGAGVRENIIAIRMIEEGQPMLVGEKIPDPYAGTARAETLLHDRLPFVYKYKHCVEK